MSGKERLQQDLQKAIVMPIQRIAEFLIEECDNDEALEKAVQEKDKNLDACYKYITEKAKKQAVNNAAVIDDTVVFQWAKEYYLKKETKKEEKPAEKKDTKKKTTKKEEPVEVANNESDDEDWLG